MTNQNISYAQVHQGLVQLKERRAREVDESLMDFLVDSGFARSISAEEFEEYNLISSELASIEAMASCMFDDRSDLGKERYALQKRVGSIWHRLWSRKDTIEEERKLLDDLEDRIEEADAQRSEIHGKIEGLRAALAEDINNDMRGRTEREVYSLLDLQKPGYLNISGKVELDHKKLPELYSGSESVGYVRISALGCSILKLLSECCLKESDFEVDANLLTSNRSIVSSIDFLPEYLFERQDGVNIEPLVPLLPDITDKLQRRAQYSGCGKPCEEAEGFMARFEYASAVPLLIKALEMPALRVELVNSKEIDSRSRTEYEYYEGTFGGGESTYCVTSYTFDNTYRMGSPVAEGAKKALLKIRAKNDDLAPQIDSAIAEYEKKLPENMLVTERDYSEDKVCIGYRKTVDNR